MLGQFLLVGWMVAWLLLVDGKDPNTTKSERDLSENEQGKFKSIDVHENHNNHVGYNGNNKINNNINENNNNKKNSNNNNKVTSKENKMNKNNNKNNKNVGLKEDEGAADGPQSDEATMKHHNGSES